MSLPQTTALSAGVDPRAILDFLDAQTDEQLHTLTIVRRGEVLAQGAWAPYRLDDPSLVYSLSKTFTSAVVGLCVQDGLFGYDDTIAELLPDLAADGGPVGPKMARLRVRDCLSMATGHETDLIAGFDRRSLDSSAVVAMLHDEPTGEPGVTFCYNQIATYTLSVLVERLAGKDLLQVLTERILGPIGAPSLCWQRDDQGRPLGFSGLHVDPQTLVSFWALVGNQGVWDGQQLLAPEWVAGHRTKQVENAAPGDRPGPDQPEGNDWARGYGWQVWMQSHGYRGDGAYGQYGIVLPDQELVVVITSEVHEMQVTLDNLWRHLLPGVDRPGTADDQAELDARLQSLSLPALDGDLPTEPMAAQSGPVTVRAEAAGEQVRLTWVDDDGTREPMEQVIAIGRGRWERSELAWPEGHLAVACSGGVVDGVFVAELRMLNNPHTLTVRIGGPEPVLTWRLEPMSGPRSIRDLAMLEQR